MPEPKKPDPDEFTSVSDPREIRQTLLTLRRIMQAVIHSTDEKILLDSICRILVEQGGHQFVWVGYKEEGSKRILPVSSCGDDQSYLEDIHVSWEENEFGCGPTGKAVRTGLPVVETSIEDSPDFKPWRERAIDRGYCTSIALPLRNGPECFGALNIYSPVQNLFTEEVQELLMEMADDLAFGIVDLRRHEQAEQHEKQMHALIDHNPDAILILDTEGKIEFANRAVARLLGRYIEHLPKKLLRMAAARETDSVIELWPDTESPNGDSEPRMIELRLAQIEVNGGNKTLAFLHDLTERMKAERIVIRMGRILAHSWNEIYIYSADTLRFVDVSLGARRQLGYTVDEMVKMTPLDIEPGISSEQFEARIEPLLQGLQQEMHFETLHQRKDGTCYPVEMQYQLSHEESPPVFIAIAQDISERKHYISELEHKTLHDALTDLPNRLLLQDRLDTLIKASRRDNAELAVITMSVLRMNEINDLMGDENGDRVLKEIADRLVHMCRESDTVARRSGNDFVIVLDATGYEYAMNAVERMMVELQRPMLLGEMQLEVEMIFGIALYPEHGDDPNTLLMRSDIAMRTARNDGVSIETYNTAYDPFSLRKLKLRGELRRAIDERTLAVHYQPKVNIKSGRVASVEALARWPHPQEGMIPPVEFIPMIEQSGLIHPFTLWILEEAIIKLRSWADTGIDLGIAVNLSTRNLLDADLVDNLGALLARYEIDPEKLTLEITESSLMYRPAQALSLLEQIHAMGVNLSIDDFGTGYSSLAYLRKLPVQEIKIDRTFVDGLANSEDDAVIVRSTIDLAHNLGLKTVAEGVENREVLDLLALLGCIHAQGFYLARPLPSEELDRWLQESPWGIAPS